MTDRQPYHHGHLAEALKDEAIQLVRAEGVHGFSLRAAARGVGVDVAAVYRHYRDKGALLREVARVGFLELAAAMRPTPEQAADPQERLRAVGRAYVRFAVSEPELFRLMFGPFGAGGEEPLFGSGRSPAFESLKGALEEIRVAGLLTRPADVAATAAWSAVHGFATLLVDGPLSRDRVEAGTEEILEFVLAGLITR